MIPLIPVGAAAETTRLPSKEFSLARRTVRIGDDGYVRNLGVFRFSPRVSFERSGSARILGSVGAEVQPGHADQNFHLEESMFGLRRKVIATNIGIAVVHVEAIEIKEGAGTISLMRPDESRRSFEKAGSVEIPTEVRASDWAEIEIRYHLRIELRDEKGRPIELPSEDGRRTVIWRPAEYGFELSKALPQSPPPRPGELVPLGVGIVAMPEFPVDGADFTAMIILQNTGELPTDTVTATWRYYRRSHSEVVRGVAPGRTMKLAFGAEARAGETIIELHIGEKRLTGSLVPRPRAKLSIGAVNVLANYSEDPIDLLFSVSNDGSGLSRGGRVVLSAVGMDTGVLLPDIPPQGKHAAGVTWAAEFPPAFPMILSLYDGNVLADSIRIPVDRARRPAPKYVLESLSFSGIRQIGAQGRLSAIVRNEGTLSGAPEVLLAVRRQGADSPVIETKFLRKIDPGARTEFTTNAFPYPSGLIRGEVKTIGLTDFTLMDISPVEASVFDSQIAFSPDSSEPVLPAVLTGSRTFVFQPIADANEMDANSAIHIALRRWDETADPAPRHAATVRVTAPGFTDRFRAASSETRVRLPIPASLLADTILVVLEPVVGIPLVLLTEPRIVAAPAAVEFGRIEAVRATETGVMVVMGNSARLVRAEGVTFAWRFGDGPEMRAYSRIPAGESRAVFLPLGTRPPGSVEARFSLPLSMGRTAISVPLFVSPDPPPVLFLEYVVEARTREGESGLLASLNTSRNATYDLDLRSTLKSGRVGTRRIPMIPENRRALVYLRDATAVGYTYLSQREDRVATTSSGAFINAAGLRIVDFGGDALIPGGRVLVRVRRCAEKAPLPESDLQLAVNGLFEKSVPAPALFPDECWFGAAVFEPPACETVAVMIVETDDTFKQPAGWDVLSAILDETRARTAAKPSGPSRVDWEWTRPTIVSRTSLPETDVFARLAKAAEFAAWRVLRRARPQSAIPISVGAPSVLRALASETTAGARVKYRAALGELVSEWKATYLVLSGEALPVMIDRDDIALFHARLDGLAAMISRPSAIDRFEVERRLKEFAESLEIILGTRVRNEYL